MATDTKHEGLLVRIPENLLPQGFDPDQESFSLSFSGADLLILKRRYKNERPSERQVVRLWGDMASFSVPDVVMLVANNHMTGLLSFDFEDAHKVVYFRHGDMISASSNRKDDRLGETLVRMGKITLGDLDRAAKQITADRKLGKILVDSGLITAKELFDGVRQQTLDVIYSLFTYRDGKFNFMETDVDKQNVISLALETREVVTEGMLRDLGVADFPLRMFYPVFTGSEPTFDLNNDERKLRTFIRDGMSVEEIDKAFGRGLLITLRLLFRYKRRGLIDIVHREPRKEALRAAGPNKLERTVTDFNSIFMDVFSILQVKVQGVDVLGRLNSFFASMSPDIAEIFDQVRFQSDGSLPIAQVLSNLQAIERDDKVALAIKAFNELLYFTLFEMRNYLSHEDAERLMEIVQNMELF
jgi:hypothetical protein